MTTFITVSIASVVAILVGCAGLVVWLIQRSPTNRCSCSACESRVISTPERVEFLLKRAPHHRHQLEAIATEMIELHDATGSDADDLAECIIDGKPYPRAMRQIMNRKLQQIAHESSSESSQD